jgi:oligoendopeptidase F
MPQLFNPFEKFAALRTLDITDPEKLKLMFEELLSLDISTKELALEFQDRRDLIFKHLANETSEARFLMTTDVSNEEYKSRFEHSVQTLWPIATEYENKLSRKFLESAAVQELGPPYHIFRRNQQSEIDLFRKENIELEKQINQINIEITEIQGKLKADWQGTKVPLPSLYPELEVTDRPVRKKAYESLNAANLSVADTIDGKFDELMELRHKMAEDAGFSSFTDYRFKVMRRFDWGPEDCFAFHKAVKKHFLPIIDKLLEQRKAALKLDRVRPYDMRVDCFGREPLRIYEKGDSTSLIAGAGKILQAIDDELYRYFTSIRDNNLLDLDARENKAPGGYMSMYPVFEQASVFYNGAGMAYDLMVLLHELGHCFHYFLSEDVKPHALQRWTSEVGEGGSMSMEFIGLENLHQYLNEDQCKRMKEDRLRDAVYIFPNCARVDAFQHWLYANPGHSREERCEKWKELTAIYRRDIDMDEYTEDVSRIGWQFQHILQMPFYYIDYAISEILALTIWERYKQDPNDSLKHYKRGCSLGGSSTVPEIYEAFGIRFSFDEDVIAPLADRLQAELGI